MSPILDDLSAQRVAEKVAPMLKTPNGRNGEWVRWSVGLAMAALVAYFTAIGTIKEEVTGIKATENAHFEELLRRFEVMQQDIRELRGERGR